MAIPRVGVILSGCGVFDGAEIHESVVTLLALDRAGAEIVCMAPDMAQANVVNHLTGNVAPGETRNVLVEAARIARGAIVDMRTIDPSTLDALILPGGFGAAKNLCNFAVEGPGCTAHPEVARVVRGVHAASRPIGAMCIAPAVLATLLGNEHPDVTIGTDEKTATGLTAMGAHHIDCGVTGIVVDRRLRLVSTPAYMLAASISEAAKGIEALVAEVLRLVAMGSDT